MTISLFFACNTIIYPSLGNHKLTATAKVVVKICEHEVSTYIYLYMYIYKYILGNNDGVFIPERVNPFVMDLQMNEIEVCPECYLSACQKRDNWFCEPCVSLAYTPLLFPSKYYLRILFIIHMLPFWTSAE